VVFPECALTGYGFGSKEQAWPHAEPVPGPSVDRIVEVCRETGRWAIAGLLERDGERLFNCAVLLGPEGMAGLYRKMHLLHLGVDRFTTPGDLGFPVFTTPLGRIGIQICFDGSFPEASRVQKLAGAQLICLATNWPEAAEVSCRYSPMVRAQENHVNFVACDRAGEESRFRFRGESKICDFNGKVLAEAGRDETTIIARLDLEAADRNRVVNIPGEYEIDRIAARRPEFYGDLAETPAEPASDS
jgi:predicted amidohydrolase